MRQTRNTSSIILTSSRQPLVIQANDTISDDEGDGIFTVGETVDDAGAAFAKDINTDLTGTGTFVGTIDINGTDYPIFSDADSGGTLSDVILYVAMPLSSTVKQLSN